MSDAAAVGNVGRVVVGTPGIGRTGSGRDGAASASRDPRSRVADAPGTNGLRGAPALVRKPSGPMIYSVEKGANALPWLPD